MKTFFSSARLPVMAALALTLVCAPACKRHKVTVQTIEEPTSNLASVVATADPHAATQLLSGFYGIEQNAWRWTAGRFSVLLRPPRGAATKGAVLQLKFTIPETSMPKMKMLTLTGYVNGTPLAPETYAKAGQYTYSRDVPAALLPGDSARIDFSLDKTMMPEGADRRELGVVASMIGFQPK